MKFHFFKVVVDIKYLYRLLNSCKNITLYNLEQKDEIFSFNISFKDYTSFKNICENLDINIIGLEEAGLFCKIFKRNVMLTTVYILLIFVLFLIANSLFVWKISVQGNYSNSSNQIINCVNEEISLGVLKYKVNTENIESLLRSKFDNISWVCVEIKGTNLIIHIKETYISEIAEIEDKPFDIVANRSGIIKSIVTRKGMAQVKVGDAVKKGDVLIAGKVPVLSEYEEELFDSYYSADGTIMAETTRKIDIRLNKTYKEKYNTNIYNVYMPTIYGHSWNLKLEDKNITKEDIPVKLWGDFYLPIIIEKYVVESAKYKTSKYNLEQAEIILNNKFLYKLSKMEQKDYKILKKDVKIIEDKNSYRLYGEIKCLEPFGKVKYIDVETTEEGTTILNEYN